MYNSRQFSRLVLAYKYFAPQSAFTRIEMRHSILKNPPIFASPASERAFRSKRQKPFPCNYRCSSDFAKEPTL